MSNATRAVISEDTLYTPDEKEDKLVLPTFWYLI